MRRRVVEGLKIEGLSHEGRGLATKDGKRQFVLGALPGETINAYILKRSKQFDELCVTDVIEPSEKRISPKCDYFLVCGGCRLQHMSPEHQLEHKAWRLKEHLEQIGESVPETWAEPITGPHWQYRRKARLSVRHVRKKEKVLVGFRELDGRKVAVMDSCAILHPAIERCLVSCAELIAKCEQIESIPQLEWVVGSGKAACIVRHLLPLSEHDRKLWAEFAKDFDVDVYLQAKGLDSIKPLDASTGLPHYDLPDFNLSMQFHPSFFIQVNDLVNQQLIKRAIEWLDIKPSDRIGDFFCGLGNFSLPMATQGCSVLGIEGFAPLVKQASVNAKAHNLSERANFVVEDLQKEDLAKRWKHGAFNKVLLDPPRTGAKECMPLLASMRPEKIVYVSCHTATLARDAKLLKELGYTLTKACVADMFPQTDHVESMACFTLS